MTATGPTAILVGHSVGIRPLVTAAELRDLIAPLAFFWLDVFAGDETARTEMVTQLGLDAADTAWALRGGQAMRMTIGRDGVRAVTWLAESAAKMTEVHVLCSRRCVLTVWNGDPAALADARQHFLERAAELEKNPFHVAAIVLQLLLASLDQGITTLDTTLHAAREHLHKAPSASELATATRQMQRLQARWADFDRYSSAVRFAIVGVEAVPGIDPRGVAELNDYAQQVEDTEHRLHNRSQWASSIIQDHVAAVAQRQGEQINRLTLVSLIFLPLTFITGFFGMNFGWMIDVIGSAAAFLALGVILPSLCVALTIAWLRRRALI